MAATFVLQMFTQGDVELYITLFLIGPDWLGRPWSVITSIFAHGDLMHLLFNGLMLFFFGPALERIIGGKDLTLMFMAAGAASGIVQVELSGGLALGASGAIMMVFGTLVILMPKQKILVYGIVPVPFWAAGIGYAALDVLGAFNPNDGIGNFAHLSGMAMGLAYGLGLREAAKRIRRERVPSWAR